MKARVIRAYKDRVDGSVHYPNTTVDLSEKRLGELAGKGFVEPGEAEPAGDAEGPGAPDLEAMTAAQLRDLIAERGGSAPKRATKAQLLEIAGAL